jgi:hypothetical protein
MKKSPYLIFVFCFLALDLLSAAETTCARVVIEIQQELTLERQAFEARMTIRNTLPGVNITEVKAVIFFRDKNNAPVEATLDATKPVDHPSKFFYRSNIPGQALETDGAHRVPTIAGDTTQLLTWLIIPRPGAAGNAANGTLYYVGATLTYKKAGVEERVEVTPDHIYVRPMPQLKLDYFVAGQVYSDDPLTPLAEPAVPFPLAVRVHNHGHGEAVALKIESAQPVIVDNNNGAAIGFRLHSCEVNDRPAEVSLQVDFGTLPAGGIGTAAWSMTSTLSGEFTEIEASYTHSDLLGGLTTSLLDAPSSHILHRVVRVDLPGRDNLRDFLAFDAINVDVLRVYETNVSGGQPIDTEIPGVRQYASSMDSLPGTGFSHRVEIPSAGTVAPGNFFYLKAEDEFAGGRTIRTVTRSDGKRLPSENAWFWKKRNQDEWEYYLSIFDANDTGTTRTFSYVVDTGDVAGDNRPPVLAPLRDRVVAPGQMLEVAVQATDPDGIKPAIRLPVRPAGSTFTDNSDGTALFTWQPAASDEGSYVLLFSASDGRLTDEKSMRVIVAASAAGKLEAWKDRWFPQGGAESENGADPDGDGMSNLYEYALGLDPTRSSVAQKPKIGKTIDSQTGKHYLTLTYQRLKSAEDSSLSFTVLATGDPAGTWTSLSGTGTVTDLGGGLERVVMTDSVALEDSPTGRYLRLKVEIEETP